jgi:transposase, IS30 family
VRRPIATLRRTGLGVRAIAHELGGSPSTVSRELRRNRRPHDVGGYDGDLAHQRTRERACRPRTGRLARDLVYVAGPGAGQAGAGVKPGADRGLASSDLPRSACLACLPRDDLPGHLSRRDNRGLTRKLTAKLRTGRPLRKRRRKPNERATRFVA